MTFTLLFYAYALFGAPWFRGSLRSAFETEEVCLLPGLILIFALVAETIALPEKFRAWHSNNGKETGIPLKLGSAICITHVILTYFLGIYILDAFGVMGGVAIKGTEARWMAITFILLFFSSSKDISSLPPARHSVRRNPYQRPWRSPPGFFCSDYFYQIREDL